MAVGVWLSIFHQFKFFSSGGWVVCETRSDALTQFRHWLKLWRRSCARFISINLYFTFWTWTLKICIFLHPQPFSLYVAQFYFAVVKFKHQLQYKWRRSTGLNLTLVSILFSVLLFNIFISSSRKEELIIKTKWIIFLIIIFRTLSWTK